MATSGSPMPLPHSVEAVRDEIIAATAELRRVAQAEHDERRSPVKCGTSPTDVTKRPIADPHPLLGEVSGPWRLAVFNDDQSHDVGGR